MSPMMKNNLENQIEHEMATRVFQELYRDLNWKTPSPNLIWNPIKVLLTEHFLAFHARLTLEVEAEEGSLTILGHTGNY